MGYDGTVATNNDVKNTDRIRSEVFRSKIVTADEAAELIHDGAAIGFSGFVGAGYPKAVPAALAKKAESLHAKGEPFQVRVYTGASTDHALDGILAESDAVSFRTPFSTDGSLRRQINSGHVGYIDTHLSHLAQQVEEGFLDHLDFAVIEISGIDEEGHLIPSTSLGNNKTWLEQADKVILEVNEWQPEALNGVHDVYYSVDVPPHRKPIPLVTAHDRIGRPWLEVDPEKVVGVIETEGGDRNTKFTRWTTCQRRSATTWCGSSSRRRPPAGCRRAHCCRCSRASATSPTRCSPGSSAPATRDSNASPRSSRTVCSP